jgi:Legume lectin domain/Chitobiase/beta-hexosaminidase C-terminal domain
MLSFIRLGSRAIRSGCKSRFAFNFVVLVAVLGALWPQLGAQVATPVNVPTWRYDTVHAGQNTQETLLTPGNVAAGSFGKLFSYAVDGFVYAQPLYVSGLEMSDGLVHNVLFVATEHDSIYGFDADSDAGANAQPLWHASLLTPAYGAAASGVTTVPAADVGVNDLVPEIGITGTPAINLATGTLYVVGKTKENGAYVQRLHAINVITGAEQPNSPVVIQGTVSGTGSGSSGGHVSFSPLRAHNRVALDYYNGYVYIAFGSHGDMGEWHGWVMAYDAVTLAQTALICLSPNGIGVGVWGAGAGLPIDNGGTAGRMFLVTGNGTFSSYPPFTSANNYGDSIVQFSLGNGTLTPTDAFTVFNQASLSAADLDQGSGGILMPPDQPGSVPHILIQVGKEGRILVLNRDDLGGYAPGGTNNPNALQDIPGQIEGEWGTPAYWNGNVYFWGINDYGKLFHLDSGLLTATSSSVTQIRAGFPAPTFVVSSNGTSNGIAWATRSDTYSSNGSEVLYAFDATDLSKVLYESNLSARDDAGPANKFVVPVVTNGKVYLGAAYQVNVYGLTNGAPVTAAPVFSPSGGTFLRSQTVAVSSATPSAAIYYTLDGSVPTTASTLYTGPITLTSTTTLRVLASAPGYLQSSVTTAAFDFLSQAPAVTASPAAGTYSTGQMVTLQDLDSSATIHYTTDGSTPTTSSTVYTGPIQVPASMTINAFAADPSLPENSNVSSFSYVISTGSTTINFGSGFASIAGLKLNGSAKSNNGQLQLTTGALNQAGSFFYASPINIQAFTTDFNFQLLQAVADGFTFTIQNVGPTALGQSGDALGCGLAGSRPGIANSVAVKFDLHNNAGEGNDSTGIFTDGALPTVPAVDMTSSGVILSTGDAIAAHLVYDGTTLTMTLSDFTAGKSFVYSTTVNIPQIVGSSTAYVGFTGGTGGNGSSIQNILSWTYATQSAPMTTSAPVASPPPGQYSSPQSITLTSATAGAVIYYTLDGSTPATASTIYSAPITVGNGTTTVKAMAIASGELESPVTTATYVITSTSSPTINFASGFPSATGLALNSSATVTGNVLQLTNTVNQASSAYYASPVNIQSFSTTFTFQLLEAVADGFTFTIQNSSLKALGTDGSTLGYGSSKGGIPTSIALKFDIHNNAGEGNNSTGLYLDGATPTIPAIAIPPTSVLLASGDPIQAQIIYDGTTLTLTLTDQTTGKTFTQSFNVNIPQVVGGNTAYAGFTGGTGGSSAIQNILNWVLTNP